MNAELGCSGDFVYGADRGTAVIAQELRIPGFRWSPWLIRRAVVNRRKPTPRELMCWLALTCVLTAIGCQTPGASQNADGVRYFQQGQSQTAVYQFQQALAANPTNADAYYNLAAAYHYLGKQNGDTALLEQSENLYHQCLDLSPDHVPCHRALAVLLVDTNRPQSAFTLLERWSTRRPQLSDPRIELARLHEEFGDPEVAARYLGEAIDLDPSNARAWTALAKLREADGQYAQALSNYQQAYSLNSSQPGVAQQIASLQQRMAMGGTPNAANQTMAEVPRGWTSR